MTNGARHRLTREEARRAQCRIGATDDTNITDEPRFRPGTMIRVRLLNGAVLERYYTGSGSRYYLVYGERLMPQDIKDDGSGCWQDTFLATLAIAQGRI